MIKRELLETITAEEWETIVALRVGEARVVAIPARSRNCPVHIVNPCPTLDCPYKVAR